MATMAKMNKGAGKWVVRALLILLIISFAMWGAADWVTGVQNPTVAEVGDQEIDAYTFSNEANNRLRVVSQQTGQQITPELAMQLGLYNQILNGMIDQRALDQKVTELGLAVPATTVRDMILSNPQFKDQDGNFSRQRFEFLLQNQRLNEAGYVALARADIALAQYRASLALGLDRAPRSIANALYDYQAEKRSAEYVVIPNSKLAEIGEPTEEQLAKFHTDNAATYTAPEYRTANVLVVTNQDLADKAEVTEQEISDRYEDRQDQYTVPEQRTVVQMIFDTEEDAKKGVAQLNEGKTFNAVAKDLLDMAPEDTELGTVGRDDLLDDTREVVFGLDKNGISAPVKSGFGWHVFQVTDVKEGSTQPLADVADSIRRDLQLEKAEDMLFDVSNQVQDEVAGGSTVADTADRLKLELRKIGPISIQGNDQAGKAIDLPLKNLVVQEIFRVTADQEPEMQENGENTAIYVVEVTDVIEPALRPLDTVRADLITQWKKRELANAANEKLAKLTEEAQNGVALADIAQRFDLTAGEAKDFTRSLGAADIPAELRVKLFDADKGSVADGANDANESKVIARLTAISPADRDQGKSVIDQIVQEYGTSFARDIDQALREALRSEMDVSVNQEAMLRAADPTFTLQQ